MKKKPKQNIYLSNIYYDDDVELVESKNKKEKATELDDNYIDYGGE